MFGSWSEVFRLRLCDIILMRPLKQSIGLLKIYSNTKYLAMLGRPMTPIWVSWHKLIMSNQGLNIRYASPRTAEWLKLVLPWKWWQYFWRMDEWSRSTGPKTSSLLPRQYRHIELSRPFASRQNNTFSDAFLFQNGKMDPRLYVCHMPVGLDRGWHRGSRMCKQA